MSMQIPYFPANCPSDFPSEQWASLFTTTCHPRSAKTTTDAEFRVSPWNFPRQSDGNKSSAKVSRTGTTLGGAGGESLRVLCSDSSETTGMQPHLVINGLIGTCTGNLVFLPPNVNVSVSPTNQHQSTRTRRLQRSIQKVVGSAWISYQPRWWTCRDVNPAIFWVRTFGPHPNRYGSKKNKRQAKKHMAWIVVRDRSSLDTQIISSPQGW